MMLSVFTRLLSPYARPGADWSGTSPFPQRECRARPVRPAQSDARPDGLAGACVHTLFEAQVRRTPDAVAAIFEGRSISYRALNARANQLARYLVTLGVGPEVLVGVCLERSLEMAVGLLGILKAGGAYVPLDPDDPAERLDFVVADCQPAVVVTTSPLASRFSAPAAALVRLDTDQPRIAGFSPSDLLCRTSPDNAVYVIYTSGSTGKPKGAVNLHRGVCNLLRWEQQTMGLDASDRFLMKTTLGFDVSVQEFFRGLICGGCVVIARPGGQREPEYLVDLMIRQAVTTADFVPAMLRLILQQERIGQCGALRRVSSVGDVLPPELKILFFRRSSATFYNAYGPTETSVVVARWQCRPDYEFNAVPIGQPAFNVRLYVLDEDCRPVPTGVAGELFIAGAAVGRGYLNRPELTAQRFLPDPFSPQIGDRMYRTGDRCRHLPDGNVEFLGRVDYQLKIRGFRIEPAEIEAVLESHPGVRQGVVVAREDVAETKHLAAFCVPAAPRSPPAVSELRDLLEAKLPEYMMPAWFSMLEQLPLTARGKVDRRALQTLPLAAAERSRPLVHPGDPSQLLLTNLWEELLAVAPIGIQDDFFELGGDSLLAIKMLQRIEQLCGCKISPVAFFAEPTVLCLCRNLLNTQRSEAFWPLVEVQAGDGRRPFFFLHGDFNGGGFYCRNLARHLGPEQPFYALHPHGLIGRRVPATIQAMAGEHLELVRARQPEGPYLLGGHCNGALIALEMAQRLRAAGEQVDLVVMIAPPPPGRVGWPAMLSAGLSRLMPLLLPVMGNDFLQRRLPVLRRTALNWAYEAACRSYIPRPYAGPVVLLQPEKAIDPGSDPSLGWRGVAGNLAVHPIPGWHSTAIAKHADVVAAIIGSGLRRALAGSCR